MLMQETLSNNREFSKNQQIVKSTYIEKQPYEIN